MLAKLTEIEYLKVFERNVLEIGRDYHYPFQTQINYICDWHENYIGF